MLNTKKKKSQSAMEYLMVMGLMTALLVPIVYLNFAKTVEAEEDVLIAETDRIGKAIVSAVGDVYYSPGFAKRTLEVHLPSFVNRIYAEPKGIVIEMTTSSGPSVLYYDTNIPVVILINESGGIDGEISIKKDYNIGDFVIVCIEGFCDIFNNETGYCHDNIDNDYDGKIDECDYDCIGDGATDFDGDFFILECGDCNDTNPLINPNATEVCNVVDDDCDGSIDEGIEPDTCQLTCEALSYNWSGNGGQRNCCGDDSSLNEPPSGSYENPEVNLTDGLDNDCDGNVDPIGGPVALTCDSCANCTDKIAIASSGEVVTLINDLFAASTCISFNGTDDITLNCSGFSIIGDGKGENEYGISLDSIGDGSNNNNIIDCSGINNFYNAIFLNSSSDNDIINISISDNNNNGISLLNSDSNFFSNISISGSGLHPYNGMVLNMHMDNDSSVGEHDTHVYDWSGTGNNCTVYGNAVWNSTGRFGGAFEFDKIDDYMNCGDDDSLNISEEITLSAWVKPSSLPQGYTRIVTKSTIGPGFPWTLWGLVLWPPKPEHNNQHSFTLEIINASNMRLKLHSKNNVSVNTWYHVAATYNGTHTKLYMNGTESEVWVWQENGSTANTVIPPTNISGPLMTNNQNVTVGIIGFLADYSKFNGTIDEVGIWNRSLSASEIQAVYNHNTGSWDGDGIQIKDSDYNKFKNIITSNNPKGIHLSDGSQYNSINDSLIFNNEIYGILSNQSDKNTYNNLTIEFSGDKGMRLEKSSDNNISNLVLRNNTKMGLKIGRGSNNLVRNVASYYNEYGIGLIGTDNNTILSAIIFNNTESGIKIFHNSTGNIILDSRIKYNFHSGIEIKHSATAYPRWNYIYNNYLNNSRNVYSTHNSNTNYWNISMILGTNIIGGSWIGGNFWTDPDGGNYSDTCADGDSNGICDTPFNTERNEWDYLPLTDSGVSLPASAGINCISCLNCTNEIANANSGETVYLANDISTTSTCISFNGKDDITLNCSGFSISGDGAGIGEYGIYLDNSGGGSNNNTITDCPNINSFFNGIKIDSSSINNITNSTISNNNDDGISLDNSDNNLFTNLIVSDNGDDGIQVWNSDNNNFTDIITSNNPAGTGIYVETSVNTVLSNIISLNNNLLGIAIVNSYYSTLTNINISGNGNIGIQVWNSEYSTLTNINISSYDLAGIHFSYSNYSILTNINVSGTTIWDGINIQFSHSNTYTDITTSGNNRYGIFLVFSDNNNLTNIISLGNLDTGVAFLSSHSNILTDFMSNSNTFQGVTLQSSDNNILTNINVSNNGGVGLYIYLSDNQDIKNVIAYKNLDGFGFDLSDFNNASNILSYDNSRAGVYIFISDNNKITKTTSINNSPGILVYRDSKYNTINDSYILNNRIFGGCNGILIDAFFTDYPQFNTFYNNYFNNTVNVCSNHDSNTNYWNISLTPGTNIIGGSWIGGNFWTDPDGGNYSDTCVDIAIPNGICDPPPYNLVRNEWDYLPLAD